MKKIYLILVFVSCLLGSLGLHSAALVATNWDETTKELTQNTGEVMLVKKVIYVENKECNCDAILDKVSFVEASTEEIKTTLDEWKKCTSKILEL